MAAIGLGAILFFVLALGGSVEGGNNKEDPAGPYVIVIHSIKDMNKNFKEYANWTLRVTKKTKKGPPFIEGSLNIVKEIKGMEAVMDVWKKDTSVGQGDNWKKYNVDEMKFGSVCTNPILIVFFKQFKGIVWDLFCNFKPQNVFLTPIDVNEKLHAVMDKAEYGMFKADVKYWSKANAPPKGQEPNYVIRFELVVSVKRV